MLEELTGVAHLQAALLNGSGLRLLECCRLRIKDISFDRRQILVRSGEGDKDRAALLPAVVETALRHQVEAARVLHDHDVRRGGSANRSHEEERVTGAPNQPLQPTGFAGG